MRANLSSLQTKFLPIIFGFALFVVAFSAVKGIARGNLTDVKLLAGLVVVGGITLALDKNYWLMLPAFFMLGIKLPGLPFDGRELGCILLIAIYVLRLTLQKEKTTKPCTPLLMALPFLLWIFMVWCLNPTGLAMFGSTTVGARFYLKIILGVLAGCIMCTKAINEKDAKKLFFVIVAAQIIQSFISIFAAGLISTEVADEDRGTGRYEYLFALSIYTIMFCRYSLSDVFKSGWKFFVVAFFALLTIYTGKRKAIGTLLLLPLLRVFFTGKDKMLTFACVCFATFVLIFTVAADGAFYELPPSVQRSLSVVVPKYRESKITQDIFRYEIRQIGNEIIKDSPWVGRKGFAIDAREAIWMRSLGTDLYGGHAFTRNWHSAWYAYACDFGIPCAIGYYIALIFMLFYSVKVLKQMRYGSWSFICLLFFTLNIYISAIFSYTSGHSSFTTMGFMYNLGIIVALENGLKQDKQLALLNDTNKIA